MDKQLKQLASRGNMNELDSYWINVKSVKLTDINRVEIARKYSING